MADLTRFPRIFQETPETIRARINADANSGLAPDDPGFLDTTPGGFWYDLTQAPILEIARLYDALNEWAAAVLLPFSWGAYLDEHGVTIGQTRKDPVAATGTVTFTGTNGTLISTGTEVAVEQTDPDADPVSFRTTAAGVIAGGTLDLPVEATTFGSAGNVVSGAVTVLLSPISGVSSITNSSPISGGADVETDERYLARLILAFTGAHGSGTIDDYTEWALDYPGVGNVKVEPLWNGPGTVRVIITDVDNNAVSQTVIDGLQQRLDPYAVKTGTSATVSLPASSIPLRSTSGLQTSGQVMVADQLVTYASISGNTLNGTTGGAGTFPADTTVTQSGRGAGLAPIGAVVTVATPALLPIVVDAQIVPKTGYSVSGAGGSVALQADVSEAIHTYIDSLSPGDSVVYQAVVAAIMDVTGVLDISLLHLNGAPSNVTLTSLQVPFTQTVNVS